MIIIPIGIQCTNAQFSKNINHSYEPLPFDWMLSSPKFVFEMLTLLLEENMDVHTLVESHFFNCKLRANISGIENYHITNGVALYNESYNVIFPYDSNSVETIHKYIRRFKRLKELILTNQEEVCFLYTSPSSPTNGNFTINGNHVVNNAYSYLSKIYDLIGKYRPYTYKMIVFDTLQQEDKDLLKKEIVLCKLNRCNVWTKLLPQMNAFVHLFVDKSGISSNVL